MVGRLTCGDCRHWLPFTEGPTPIGSCKRFPPVPLSSREGQALPQTAAPDWCGEAAPMESPEA